ncbi:protein of unknown function [Candidatus Nitrosocosmicus franklandus]|uniref:Uncharacterized protein n=2 Tax=Candidatus Nitrosocosmicus franklandianus TaxID=1798806 RepID=A0A484IAM4_9ARCH|nr:protein of unknown function [Candidatus Nitrosocosmicus franklandus]
MVFICMNETIKEIATLIDERLHNKEPASIKSGLLNQDQFVVVNKYIKLFEKDNNIKLKK